MLRTPAIDVGKDFEFQTEVTKAYARPDGKRVIRGVASGVAVDRDGERLSRNAIKGMVNAVSRGGVKLTGSHSQDWMTECGEVEKAEHDPKTDEFIVDTVLPPEGVDPIADKAWRVANTEQVGFSIGGKLQKAYFEKDEVGKRRKVLDAIDLRHVMLTKKPAYAGSFAEAVAKTFDADVPAPEADEWFEEPVEKNASAVGGDLSADSDNAGGRDSATGDRNAGTKRQEDEEEDQTPSLDKVPERHLACPNCGHEFAADIPPEDDENAVAPGDDDNPTDRDNDRTAKKTAQETPMNLKDTLASLDALVEKDASSEEGDVEKTETPTEPVEKTDAVETDVEKALGQVATIAKSLDDRQSTLEAGVAEGFMVVAKALKEHTEVLKSLPQGRKSIARILPPGHDDSDVEKTTEQIVEEAESPAQAIKALNEAKYGIR